MGVMAELRFGFSSAFSGGPPGFPHHAQRDGPDGQPGLWLYCSFGARFASVSFSIVICGGVSFAGFSLLASVSLPLALLASAPLAPASLALALLALALLPLTVLAFSVASVSFTSLRLC